MKSLWKRVHARNFRKDPLALRVYTSRLLGQVPDLVLHGGGNTSVKVKTADLFGKLQEILYIKGSGGDLATIKKQGFAPVKMDVLERMAQLERLTDALMVQNQRAAMTDPFAPNPSVEAILHAIIPFKFVDHTHANSIITITNTKNGAQRIREIYDNRILLVPYVMPGFILAKKVFTMTRQVNWHQLDGMILMNHGVFTFANDARTSYEKMINLVTEAENYLHRHKAIISFPHQRTKEDLLGLAQIRRAVCDKRGKAIIAHLNTKNLSLYFANHPRVSQIATRGPLTPDHVIRTKRIPVIIKDNPERDITRFAKKYQDYFNRHAYKKDTPAPLTCLDPAPRWAIWPGQGTITFATTCKEAQIIQDITEHTMQAILRAEALGGWRALGEKAIFDVEYWDLEQAKLRETRKTPIFQGKIALVTGAASGIGRACVEALYRQGAAVSALDINPSIKTAFKYPEVLGMVYDVTHSEAIDRAIQETVRQFGGLDIVISNAGMFPPSAAIVNISTMTWQRSLEINLNSHRMLLTACIPYLRLGIDPSVVIIGSKNVPAPGSGASAYSVAKAGLTQLARVAALELATDGIRVNTVHPNQVFDTAIWTPEVLKARARHYKMSVAEYKTNNLLKTEITSKDVADLVCTLAGPIFAKTTGAQIPIDGGNDRVI